MSLELDPSGAGLVFSLVRMALADWEPHDVRRYLELAYRDPEVELYIQTDSAVAARTLAQGVSQMLVERMKALRARDERRLLP